MKTTLTYTTRTGLGKVTGFYITYSELSAVEGMFMGHTIADAQYNLMQLNLERQARGFLPLIVKW